MVIDEILEECVLVEESENVVVDGDQVPYGSKATKSIKVRT